MLYCGRLDPDKGIHKLMEAIAALHEPHIKLLIVGSPFFARTQQSTFQRKLEQQAKSLGNRVQFTGYIPNEDLPDYREGVYVGYRWYDARKMPVRWPFGHGLSYTGYVYRGAALDADTLTPGGTVTARVTVKNSGAMRGAEVVQLYVADATGAPVPGGRVPRPLRRFAKIDLQPGEERP